jgi:uncharacterized membrane protein YhaH (DUF805 family)
MFERLYLSPRGRCSRQFYWLLGVIPFVALGFFLGILIGAFGLDPKWGAIALLATLWPSLAMQIKRWHDINLAGWWALLSLIPFFNLLVIVCLGLIPGTPGANRFGPNPLDSHDFPVRAP